MCLRIPFLELFFFLVVLNRAGSSLFPFLPVYLDFFIESCIWICWTCARAAHFFFLNSTLWLGDTHGTNKWTNNLSFPSARAPYRLPVDLQTAVQRAYYFGLCVCRLFERLAGFPLNCHLITKKRKWNEMANFYRRMRQAFLFFCFFTSLHSFRRFVNRDSVQFHVVASLAIHGWKRPHFQPCRKMSSSRCKTRRKLVKNGNWRWPECWNTLSELFKRKSGANRNWNATKRNGLSAFLLNYFGTSIVFLFFVFRLLHFCAYSNGLRLRLISFQSPPLLSVTFNFFFCVFCFSVRLIYC